MVYEDRDELINLLRQNGVVVNDNVSDDELLTMTYVAIGKSTQFKRDLAQYLELESRDEASLNYVSEQFFNQDGKQSKKLVRQENRLKKRETRKTDVNPTGKSKAGQAVAEIGTKENIQAAINTGLGVLAQKLTSKADRDSINAATNLAVERSKQAAIEAQAEDKKSSAKAKWVVPVVIGVAVIAIAGGIFYFMRRKKA
jgi:cobalamin biosynthesis Mg chelatase CobN